MRQEELSERPAEKYCNRQWMMDISALQQHDSVTAVAPDGVVRFCIFFSPVAVNPVIALK